MDGDDIEHAVAVDVGEPDLTRRFRERDWRQGGEDAGPHLDRGVVASADTGDEVELAVAGDVAERDVVDDVGRLVSESRRNCRRRC